MAVNIPNSFFSNQTAGAARLAGGTIGDLIGKLLPNIIIGAAVIFFFFILVAGFPIISGAGKDSSPQEKAKAQSAVTFAIVGFLLIVTSFFILQIVQTVLGVNFITPNL